MEQQYGITMPLSTNMPTDAENRSSNALIEELKRENNYESVADTQKRTAALTKLLEIAREFVRIVGRDKYGLSDEVASAGNAKVFTFGSFRLGVFGPGSDIDTLVVGPTYVTRSDFFEVFPDLLVKMTPEGTITDLTPVTDAFVPIIKFEYAGISIDLIYSRIDGLQQIPEKLDLKNDKILRGLDETDLRSLNGTRVTDTILELVPQPSTFKTALRAIKLWAQRRAIYANIMGFPGGVAWAMLVARVCQLYPKAASAVIIHKFFKIIDTWNWPTPVILRKIETNGPLPPDKVRVWNPRVYRGDSFHMMPIITPAYPSMCATHNITKSTMAIIMREIRRGEKVAEQILYHGAPWKNLFAKHNFFTEGYKYYLSIVSASTTSEAQKIWSGCVESKVRFLVINLENHKSIALAHPFNKGYTRTHRCRNDAEISKVKGGSLDYVIRQGEPETIKPEVTDVKDEPKVEVKDEVKSEAKAEVKAEVKDEDGVSRIDHALVKRENGDELTNGDAKVKSDDEGEEKITLVYTTTYYVGLELAADAKSLDLSFQVDEFKARCTNWDKYNDQVNALSIVTTKNTDLPDDVFEPGEVKPKRPAKKKVAGKKRTPSDDTIAQPPAKRHQSTPIAS